MPLAVTINNVDVTQDSFLVRGTLAASGSYVAGGDTLDFSGQGNLPVATPPRDLFVHGVAGFVYEFVRGALLTNSKLKVRGHTPTSATAGVIPLEEITAAAYPAGVTGDTISFVAVFDKLL